MIVLLNFCDKGFDPIRKITDAPKNGLAINHLRKANLHLCLSLLMFTTNDGLEE
jgi:hypothetical protein